MSLNSLQSLTQDQLVAVQSTAFAAQSQTDVRDDQGEPLGDIWGANAIAFLQILANALYVSNKSRLATCGNVSGNNPQAEYSPDVDAFVNPFGIYRDAATYSIGTETFALPSPPNVDTYILPGTTITTPDGSVTATVVADSGQSAYTASGYLIPAYSSAAINVTIQCTVAGTIGNVAANTLTQLTSGVGSLPLGNFTVTNPQAFTNGTAGETDAALALRFQNEFISGRYATHLAIQAAIAGAGADLTYQIAEGVNASNAATVGFFTVFVNVIGSDASTPDSVLAAVSAAIASVKALGISYAVVAPSLEVVPAAATLHVDPNWILIPGNTLATVQAAATAAYDSYVNNLGLSVTGTTTLLSYAKVSAVLVLVPGVLNVSSFTLNSATSDITAAFGTQLVAGTTTFTATTS